MEISQIKSRLSILDVLSHYGLKADKQQRLCCPFHEDTTPSMQIYPQTNTFCCFSSNCQAGTGDVIEFIALYEKQGKHQALLKAKSLIQSQEVKTEELSRSAVLTKAFTLFINAFRASSKAKAYTQGRALAACVEVGYNAGTLTAHNKPLVASFAAYGLLYKNRFGTGLSVFAKNSIVFALRGADNHITGLYFRSLENDPDKKHYYLKDRAGLYPAYPGPDTRTLILTESVIDAASLAGLVLPFEHYAVLALYGTNGFTVEHQQAISGLASLQEIILFFDGDPAGRQAAAKYKEQFSVAFPSCRCAS